MAKTRAQLKTTFITDRVVTQADMADIFDSVIMPEDLVTTSAATASIPFRHTLTQLAVFNVSADVALVPDTAGALAGSRTVGIIVADGVHTVDCSAFTIVEGSTFENEGSKKHFFEMYYTGDSFIMRFNPLSTPSEAQPAIPYLTLDFDGKNILFFGDSITAGYSVTTGYPELLCTAADGVCVNHGISGQVLEDRSYEGRVIFDKTTIPAKGPSHKYVFIALGVNDIDKSEGGFTVSAFKTKLTQVVEYAIGVRGWKASDIVLVTPFYIKDSAATYERKESYAAAVREVAFTTRTVLLDAYLWMRDYPSIDTYIPDALHPNQDMHNILAGIMGWSDYRTEYQKSLRTNWALATKGATPSASNTLGPNNTPAKVINGVRNTNNKWDLPDADGGGWFSGNSPGAPFWWQVDFVGSKTISEVNVISLQETISTTVDPTLSTISTTFNVVDYKLQRWDGSGWVDIVSVTGNNKAWRKYMFPPITTTKMRVYVTGVGSSSYKAAPLVEFEAWGD